MQHGLKTPSFALAMCILLIVRTSFVGVHGEAETYDLGPLWDNQNSGIDYTAIGNSIFLNGEASAFEAKWCKTTSVPIQLKKLPLVLILVSGLLILEIYWKIL